MIRIISAEPLPQYRLKVAFNDGVSGIFPVEPERRGGVFLKLLDARVFNAVTVNLCESLRLCVSALKSGFSMRVNPCESVSIRG